MSIMRLVELQVYEDSSGMWRWRLVSKNRKIVADSAEGYSSKSNAKKAARGLITTIRNRHIHIKTLDSEI